MNKLLAAVLAVYVTQISNTVVRIEDTDKQVICYQTLDPRNIALACVYIGEPKKD